MVNRAYARDELNRIERLRFIAEGLRQGQTQETLASALQISQPTVHRLARQTRNNPALTDTSPSEVIYRGTVGEITRAAMARQLVDLPLTTGADDPTGHEAYVRGTWDQIENAAGRGLITETEYETLRDSLDAPPPMAMRAE